MIQSTSLVFVAYRTTYRFLARTLIVDSVRSTPEIVLTALKPAGNSMLNVFSLRAHRLINPSACPVPPTLTLPTYVPLATPAFIFLLISHQYPEHYSRSTITCNPLANDPVSS